MYFTACTMVATAVAAMPAHAQTVVPGDGTSPDLNAYQIKKVQILYKKLLQR